MFPFAIKKASEAFTCSSHLILQILIFESGSFRGRIRQNLFSKNSAILGSISPITYVMPNIIRKLDRFIKSDIIFAIIRGMV